MKDREKVIRGLECCTKDECECCPYEDVCFGDDEVELFDTLARDALALLKAQEPVEPKLLVMNGRLSNGTKYICGGCGGSFFHQKVNFCPWCGRAVRWT